MDAPNAGFTGIAVEGLRPVYTIHKTNRYPSQYPPGDTIKVTPQGILFDA